MEVMCSDMTSDNLVILLGKTVLLSDYKIGEHIAFLLLAKQLLINGSMSGTTFICFVLLKVGLPV